MAEECNRGETFRGIVHDIRGDRVLIRFHNNFKAVGKHFNVSFQPNRGVLKNQHRALLEPISNPDRLLFPEPGHEGLASPIDSSDAKLKLFNKSIGGNTRQIQAVRSILALRPGMAPFIVFGP